MQFEMPELPGANTTVWPPEPEVARYAYIGDITGESNFRSAASDTQKGFSKFLRILVGLNGNNDERRVLGRPQSGTVANDERIYVTDVSQWETVARAHASFFGEIRPANTLVEVSALVGDGYLVEIEAEAIIGAGQ